MTRAGYGRDLRLSLRMCSATVLLLVLYLPFAIWIAGVLMVVSSPFRWLLVAAAAIGLPLVVGNLAERAALATVSARIVDEGTAPEVHAMVARLCIAADMPKPRIALAETAIPNSLAAGRSPRNSVIVVTRGLIDRLEPQELEAVLAHELSHIANHDALVMTALALPALAGRRLLAWWVRTPLIFFVPFLFIVWLAYALATLALMSLSRYREFSADRGAAVLTGAPEQLMSALQKIALDLPLIPERDLRAAIGANALFVVPAAAPSDGFHIDPLRIFPTHPPLARRLAALGALARKLGRLVPGDHDADSPSPTSPTTPNSFAAPALFIALTAWGMLALFVLDLVQDAALSVPAWMTLLPPVVWALGVFVSVQALGRAQATGAGVAISTAALLLLLAPLGLAVVAAALLLGALTLFA